MSRAATLLVIVWAALLTLLAATVAVTFAPLGPVKPVLNLAIAAAKGALIVWFFMRLRHEAPLMRIFALGVGAWLAVLFTLTAADVLARTG